MRKLTVAIVMVPTLISIAATAQRLPSPQPGPVSPAAPVAIGGSNLPFQPIGASDLVRLTVDDSPELSQTFRVDQQGNLNLPLLNKPISAAGLMPDVLRDEIAASAQGATSVGKPCCRCFRCRVSQPRRHHCRGGQDTHDYSGTGRPARTRRVKPGGWPAARSRPGDHRRAGQRQRAANLRTSSSSTDFTRSSIFPVTAGAQIRVPQCEQVFVVGDVKRPGAFPFQDMHDTTVLKLLALSGGLDSFSRNKAYIYRAAPGNAQKTEIEVPAATHSGSKSRGCKARRQRHSLRSDQWKTEDQRERAKPCDRHGQRRGVGRHLELTLSRAMHDEPSHRHCRPLADGNRSAARTEPTACPIRSRYASRIPG